jgi:hypothetical protein
MNLRARVMLASQVFAGTLIFGATFWGLAMGLTFRPPLWLLARASLAYGGGLGLYISAFILFGLRPVVRVVPVDFARAEIQARLAPPAAKLKLDLVSDAHDKLIWRARRRILRAPYDVVATIADGKVTLSGPWACIVRFARCLRGSKAHASGWFPDDFR